VPVYDLFAADIFDSTTAKGEFVLADDAGTTVPVTLRVPYLTSFELVPATSLRPLTRYTLTASWTPRAMPAARVTDSLTFTTGAGVAAGAPALMPAFLQHYVLKDGQKSTCDPLESGTCVSVPAGALTRVTDIDALGQEVLFTSGAGERLPYLRTGSFFVNLSGVNQGTNFKCVKLMVRAANGIVSSDATVLCGDGAPTFVIGGSNDVGCSPEGLTQNGVPLGAAHPPAPVSWPGCSVATAPSAPEAASCSSGTAPRRRSAARPRSASGPRASATTSRCASTAAVRPTSSPTTRSRCSTS